MSKSTSTIEADTVYIAHTTAVAGQGENGSDVWVRRGMRLRGSNELVQSYPGLFYRDGDPIPNIDHNNG